MNLVIREYTYRICVASHLPVVWAAGRRRFYTECKGDQNTRGLTVRGIALLQSIADLLTPGYKGCGCVVGQSVTSVSEGYVWIVFRTMAAENVQLHVNKILCAKTRVPLPDDFKDTAYILMINYIHNFGIRQIQTISAKIFRG